VILCGGRGTRISGVDPNLPKPMLPIGGRPILWHVMRIYAAQGHNDFVLALGWMGDRIRRYFLQYQALTCDFTIELGRQGSIEYLGEHEEADWRVTCLDTGVDSLTGTRVRRAAERLDDGPIMVTYGDGLADIDLEALLQFHRESGRLATITAVAPPGRFGELRLDDGRVSRFVEKPGSDTPSINGGFMVLEREAIERYIPAHENVALEREPLARLAADGELGAYRHRGFWQAMDTAPEHEMLNRLCSTGEPPWTR
jgi:glucose-1-phosphate cytidylyltransferase